MVDGPRTVESLGTATAGPPLSAPSSRLRSGGTSWPGTPREFLAYAIAYEGDDCLVWPFGKDLGGYGLVKINRKSYRAHRLTLEQSVGPPPGPSYHAAHQPVSCHNRACVNPRHLRWATVVENQADRRADGTAPVGRSNGRSKLTEADVVAIRADRRSHTTIAADYGVSQVLVSRIKRRESWTHVA